MTSKFYWKISLLVIPLLVSLLFVVLVWQLPSQMSKQVSHVVTTEQEVINKTELSLESLLTYSVTSKRDRIYYSVPYSDEVPSRFLLDQLEDQPSTSENFYLSTSTKAIASADIIAQITREPSESGYRRLLRVKKGESFVMNTICGGIAIRYQYALSKVDPQNKEWVIQLVKNHESRSELIGSADITDKRNMKNSVSPIDNTPILLKSGSFERAGVEQSSSFINLGTEILVPVYVSNDEVIFYLDRLAC